MIWLGIAIGAMVLIIVVGVRARGRTQADVDAADVDPVFTMGIVLTGAGVALATTVGPVMYTVMVVGLMVMAIGAHRTRHNSGG